MYMLDLTYRRLRDANYGILRREDFRWVVGDSIVLRFQAVEFADGAWADATLPSGATFELGIKLPTNMSATTYLAYAGSTAWNDVADWAYVDVSKGKICCRLDLNTQELRDLFQTSDEYKTVRAEIVMTVGGRQSTLAQWDVDVLHDVLQGGEGTPAPATPEFWSAIESKLSIPAGMRLVVDESGNIRVEAIQ